MSTAPAGQTKYADALEWAFDAVKAAVDADAGGVVGLHRDRQFEHAQLCVGLAVAVELRLLRTEWAARDDRWQDIAAAWLDVQEANE